MAGFPNEWMFRLANPNLPKYQREREMAAQAAAAQSAPARPVAPPVDINAWPQGDVPVEALRAKLLRTRTGESPGARHARWAAQGPASVPGAPAAQLPAAATPPIAPPTVAASTPPAQSAAPSRGAMVGPPAPMEGPPEPPSSDQSLLDSLDPAMVDEILSLGDKERQLAFAEKLRDQQAPGGYQAGRVYIASSPLEHAASAWQRFKGKRDSDRIGEEQVSGRKRILDVLRKQ